MTDKSSRKSRSAPEKPDRGSGNFPGGDAGRFGGRPGGHGGGRSGRRRSGAGQTSSNADTETFIFGLHPVRFALANMRREINRVRATENGERRLADVLGKRDLVVERVSPRDLDRLLGADTVHQGVLLDVAPLETFGLDELSEASIASRRPLIVLDQVTDPHNVGAVLRSAAVFGGAGLIMTRRHSPPLGGALAKAASGGLELVPIALVQNLGEAVGSLKEAGWAVAGLDGEPDHALIEDGLASLGTRPLVLALGAEGKGLRERTRNACTVLLRIGGDGPIASLNVSNAAAVALHMARMNRQR